MKSKLQKLMDDSYINDSELARELGISRQAVRVNRINGIKGRRHDAMKYAIFFCVSVDEIMGVCDE